MWIAGASARQLLARVSTSNPSSPAPEAAYPADIGPGIDAAGPAWRRGWVRVAIALVIAGQSMSFTLATNLSPPEGLAYWLLQAGLCASALLVLALLGGPLVRECWVSVRARRMTVDMLFLVTLAGTFAVSVFGSLQRRPTVYYELVAILLAIYTVGKLLGARSRARALASVEAWRAEHDTCLVLDSSGRETPTPASAVQPGQRVRIPAGAAIPVDGRIAEGRGWVLTTPLTGELEPATLGPGDAVFAGMRSVDGVFVVEVSAAGGQRRLDRMLGEVATAQLTPSRIQRQADRLAARFVPLVIATSAGTFAAWLALDSLDAAIVNSLAVTVVACPCALGLATPLGIWSGLVRLSRLGLVARTGDFIETLARATTALFDKTGTLCEPDLAVGAFRLEAGSPLGERELRVALAAAERGVPHPVAGALRRLGAEEDGSGWRQVETQIVPAMGIRARVARPGVEAADHLLLAGEPGWIASETGTAVSAAGAARRVIAVAVDGRLAARIELQETPRERAGATFARLRELGVASAILTGDRSFPESVWPDVPRTTGMSPEDKAHDVRARKARGDSVLFVGDGINDAPALAAADGAIAIRQGADLARSSAMAVLAGDSLASLPEAILVARGVHRAIHSNLVLAAVYNATGMAIAAAGWLHPVLAALLMALSSVVVSTRVVRAGGRGAPAAAKA